MPRKQQSIFNKCFALAARLRCLLATIRCRAADLTSQFRKQSAGGGLVFGAVAVGDAFVDWIEN
jgi:hypothetical protein